MAKKRKKIFQMIRVPLPRQTEKIHEPAKGGRYNRNSFRRETRRQIEDRG